MTVLLVAVPLGAGHPIANRSNPARPAADLGAGHEDVVRRAADGVDLAAPYVPSLSRAA